MKQLYQKLHIRTPNNDSNNGDDVLEKLDKYGSKRKGQ